MLSVSASIRPNAPGREMSRVPPDCVSGEHRKVTIFAKPNAAGSNVRIQLVSCQENHQGGLYLTYLNLQRKLHRRRGLEPLASLLRGHRGG